MTDVEVCCVSVCLLVCVVVARGWSVARRRVKYAKHKDTGDAVAIKVMNKSTIKERDFTAQVKHEVLLLACWWGVFMLAIAHSCWDSPGLWC